ncbi:MAG TPA: hypothetical protein VGB75_02925 [Jatrophihabitans sp.]|jgi:hypothetical protein|uniref:hypothetical protein n=1 Tax=Jatrophihabitans sp. TaxID=1932789 RepID=UPI002F1F5449
MSAPTTVVRDKLVAAGVIAGGVLALLPAETRVALRLLYSIFQLRATASPGLAATGKDLAQPAVPA